PAANTANRIKCRFQFPRIAILLRAARRRPSVLERTLQGRSPRPRYPNRLAKNVPARPAPPRHLLRCLPKWLDSLSAAPVARRAKTSLYELRTCAARNVLARNLP